MLKSRQLLPDLRESATEPREFARDSRDSSAPKEMPAVHRRSERVSEAVSILLIGTDAEGKSFIEETKTVLLSRHGASLISTHKLAVEQELLLVNRERNQEAPIRVIGQVGREGNSYSYGVAFVDPEINFWEIGFEALTETECAGHCIEIECCVCRNRISADANDFESELCTSGAGLLQYCQNCGSTTRWRPARADTPGRPIQSHAMAAPPPARQPTMNRRRHVRAKVTFRVLIRMHGNDHVAVCENVSRGGLCFRTDHRCLENAQIEVAAPYAAGSATILVPATIVHVEQQPGDHTFRCGVRYLEATERLAG